MKQLPILYGWLAAEPGPAMLVEALRHYGELEHKGKGSNVDIMAWAKEVGVNEWYTSDDIPWCGLFVAVVTQRCKYPHPRPHLVLAAAEWAQYGNPVNGPACLWDILVFKRPGGGHVGFCVGANDKAYLVYGGNQSDAVGFAWIDKTRLVAKRRPAYRVGTPANVREIKLTLTGNFSTNEK
jgi:uncharacterized protein (TIGR02594 family)